MKVKAKRLPKIDYEKAIQNKYPDAKGLQLVKEQKVIDRTIKVFKDEAGTEYFLTEEKRKVIEVISRRDYDRSKLNDCQKNLEDFNEGKYKPDVTLTKCPSCDSGVRPVFNTVTKEYDYLCSGCYKIFGKDGSQLKTDDPNANLKELIKSIDFIKDEMEEDNYDFKS